jgi:hypothetical protein
MTDSNIFFKNVKEHPEDFYIIHYSSQHLYDEDLDGLSPRITSIVIMNFSTRQTVSFSIHTIAEILGFSKEEVSSNYDTIGEFSKSGGDHPGFGAARCRIRSGR